MNDIIQGTQILVELFGIIRQGTVIRQIDNNHVEYILADYPGNLYTAKISDVRLSSKLNESLVANSLQARSFRTTRIEGICRHCKRKLGAHWAPYAFCTIDKSVTPETATQYEPMGED